MKSKELQRKLFSSPIFLFFWFTFICGALLQVLLHFQDFSLLHLLISGIPYGLILTIITLVRIKKFERTVDLKETDKRMQLAVAFKSGRLPKDSEVKRALIAQLDQRERSSKRDLRYWLPFMVLVCFVGLLTTIPAHEYGIALATLVIIFFTAYLYVTTKKRLTATKELRKQLDKEGV